MLFSSTRARRLMLAIAAGFIALVLLSTALFAQTAPTTRDTSRTWYIFADTAGIDQFKLGTKQADGTVEWQVQPDQYVTWVFAKASPEAFPSSGILVVWNCSTHQVRRLVQVKYQLRADSLGVVGDPEVVDRPWQDVQDERLYALVCSIGPQHAREKAEADENDQPSVIPAPQQNPWLAPGKPRIDS